MSDERETFESSDVSVDSSGKTRAKIGWVAVASFAAAFVSVVMAHALPSPGWFVGGGIMAGVVFLVGRAIILPRFVSRGSTVVESDRGRLRLGRGGSSQTIERRTVRAAHIDENDAASIELTNGDVVRIATHGVLQSAKVIDLLGLKPTRVRRVALLSAADRGSSIGRIFGLLTLVLASPLGLLMLVLTVRAILEWVLGRFVLEDILRSAVATLGFLGVAAALVRYFRGKQAIVGTDGVVVRSFLGKRFVPFARIQTVERVPGGILLVLRDGRVVELPVSFYERYRRVASASNAEIDALLKHIRRGLETATNPDPSRARLAELDRANRSSTEWRNAIQALVSHEGGYRGVAVETEELVAIAEEAGAPPERRVGAALAIFARGDTEQRRRVRIAAAGSADDDMKVALEAAAEGQIAEAELSRATFKRSLD